MRGGFDERLGLHPSKSRERMSQKTANSQVVDWHTTFFVSCKKLSVPYACVTSGFTLFRFNTAGPFLLLWRMNAATLVLLFVSNYRCSFYC